MFTQWNYFELKKVRYRVTLYECRLLSEIVNMMTENKASVFNIYIIQHVLKIPKKHYAYTVKPVLSSHTREAQKVAA